MTRLKFLTSLLLVSGLFYGCNGDLSPAFVKLGEARRLAADLRIEFNRAADASTRAVMADTDEASIAYAREAEQAKQAVKKDADALAPILRDLQDSEETEALAEFGRRFAKYETLDHSILELAVENTNLKAQKLAFGPARMEADTFRKSLDTITEAAPPKNRCRVESLAKSAVVAVREIQVLLAPHIAESEDSVMTGFEKEMAEREATARSALTALSGLIDPKLRATLADATAALDRFKGIQNQILALSRRNSNVRSLALTLGDGRVLTASCEASLGTLQGALAHEGFKATR
jgi:hypothetical protein